MVVPDFIKVIVNKWGYEKTLKVGCLAVISAGTAIFLGDVIFRNEPSEIFKLIEEEK